MNWIKCPIAALALTLGIAASTPTLPAAPMAPAPITMIATAPAAAPVYAIATALPTLHAPALFGDVDTAVSGLVTDLTTFFGDVKGFVILVVGFFLALWLVKKVRSGR